MIDYVYHESPPYLLVFSGFTYYHLITAHRISLDIWKPKQPSHPPSKNSKETAEWPTNPRQFVEDLHWSGGGSGFHLHPLWVFASAHPGGMGILKPSLNNFNHREKNVIIHPNLIPEDEFEAPFQKKNVVKQDAEWKQLYMEGQGLMAQVWERPLQNWWMKNDGIKWSKTPQSLQCVVPF